MDSNFSNSPSVGLTPSYNYDEQVQHITVTPHTNSYTCIYINMTQFAKTQHKTFLEIQIFASVSSIYLKLCSVAIPMLYCNFFSSYKARKQEKQHISLVRTPTAINITCTVKRVIFEDNNFQGYCSVIDFTN